ncbi:hypothetical protein I6I99_10040 [Sphingobacterium multivorum]|nr:hypothetical protein [Sphingobacterium multivorum]QQT32874.1 hypothetical protein I6I99_10040 [Sphingobacterium multivorum]
MKYLLESIMDGELENHLNEEKASGNSNRRNGKTKKSVRGFNIGTLKQVVIDPASLNRKYDLKDN